jgi:SAM-dependent methyltransferase
MDERSEPSCCTRLEPRVDPRIARRFDLRASAWTDASSLPAMVDVSAQLLDALRDAATEHPSILELGCGTGALSVALLELGAEQATGFDLSASSVDLARRRAEMAGVLDRASFSVGNAAAVTLPRADLVILDRCMCCFADADRLADAAIAAAVRRIAISVPESRGWRGPFNRLAWAAENVWDGLRGGCRGYVHDVHRLEARFASAGFRPAPGEPRHHAGWFIGIYERVPDTHDSDAMGG